MVEAPTYIPELLHDASLIGVQLGATQSTMSFVLRCLRRGPGDEDLCSVPVEIGMIGVKAVVLGHSPALSGIRPSEFEPERRVRPADLRSWKYGPQQVETFVNSAQAEEDVLTSHSVEWAAGTEQALAESAVRFAVFLEHSAMLGRPATNFAMLVGGEVLSATSQECELERAVWEQQFAAWWGRWDKDAPIPLSEDEPLDLTYAPPDEPDALLDAREAPAELLKPIVAWFDSVHRRDGLARARACANLDLEPAAQAAREDKRFEQDHGLWPYARQIEGWWTEAPVGEVVVRGIEHCMPTDEDPADNTESVWTFRLRRRGAAWVIRSWSQA